MQSFYQDSSGFRKPIQRVFDAFHVSIRVRYVLGPRTDHLCVGLIEVINRLERARSRHFLETTFVAQIVSAN